MFCFHSLLFFKLFDTDKITPHLEYYDIIFVIKIAPQTKEKET